MKRSLVLVTLAVILGISLPYLVTYFNLNPGEVLAPVVDQSRLCGDFRYYFPLVNEIKEGLFAGEYSVKPGETIASFDTLRQALFRFMFLVGGFLPDARWGFVVSYISSVVLGFWALVLLLRRLSVSAGTAFLCATCVLFCYQGLAQLFSFDIPRAANSVVHLLNLKGKLWHENLNSNFRYAVMSAVPFFVWGLLWLENVVTRPRALRIILLGVAVWVIQYLYVPISLYFDVFLIALFVHDLRRGDRRLVWDSTLAGVVGVTLFIFLGGIQHARDFITFIPPVIAESHHQGSGGSWKTAIFILTSNIVPWILYHRQAFTPVLRRYFLAHLATYSVISGLMLVSFRLEMFERFFDRGFGLLWATHTLLLVFLALEKKTWFPKLQRWVPATLAVFFLIGSVTTALDLSRQKLLRLDEDRWKTYTYLRENFPEDTLVFTTSYVDMQLIGAYTPHDLVVAGAEYLEVPKESVAGYLKGMYAVTKDLTFFGQWLNSYFEEEKRFTCTPRKKLSGAQGLETLKQLLYDPYIKNFDGVPVRGSTGFSEKFRMKIKDLEMNAQSEGSDYLKKNAEVVVVAPPFQAHGIDGFVKVFESGAFHVYRRSSKMK